MFFVLNPIAFSLGPISVHWYGIILGTAALVGLMLAIQEGKRFGIPSDFFMDLLLIGVPSAIVGARIYYVAFQWEDYKDNWVDVFKIWNGGIAIYGALIGAIIAAVFYVRRKGYSFWRIADICAPGLIVGQAIGRWGNFVNQEAHGGPVLESFLRDNLHLPNFIVNQMLIEGQHYHPTFLYESVWNLLGLVLLFVLRRQKFLRAGELFLSYFIWYSIGRFFIEALRTDSLDFTGPQWLASLMNGMWSPMNAMGFEQGVLTYGGNVRISQLLAVLIVLAAIVLIIVRRKTGASAERYSDPIVSTKTEAHAAQAAATGAAGTAEASAPGHPASVDARDSHDSTPEAAAPDNRTSEDNGSSSADREAGEQEKR
ncbi:phosphatidylglycerol:prolipoprotein diacylglycerol transferase [Paenibacillus sp. UNCCL117]|uniref:prolipoprotein diacylglyceryl transferase n=1 Tax=unclassified Paenibacillus TaxID=185978 RepID=UPI000880631D|nr:MULTISPECIES: prolipoprotein diacylglyceryl transferase [unclassified Paenibacillus]SDD52691.1 Prolipoprotein diacylglyceryl transferase [Paenibacillus sp. cl123]SFW49249.1 phosphatidylglycerol:prolipoprotein diacylglycerol transferase [Paenibacillus sp. UNCCL117]